MSEATLWWGLLFGSIGLGYVIYGRQQRAAIPMGCGIALMVFPYVVSNSWAMVLIGAALTALPWIVRL